VGRFKARLAKEPLDREMHEHLGVAERAVAKAESACIASIQALKGPSGKYGGLYARRAQANLKALRRAKAILGGVGFNVPNRDFTDTDMLSEDELAKRAAAERKLRDETARAQEQAALGEAHGTT